MVKGCAVIVYFNMPDGVGLGVEGAEEGAAEAHIAGSFSGPEVCGKGAVAGPGDVEEVGDSGVAAEELEVVPG